MENTNINYQQIYEEEIPNHLLEVLEKNDRFYELSPDERRLVEELVNSGYRRAISDLLDREVLEDTAALAGDMGTQLYNFANMLNAYLAGAATEDDS